MATLEYNEFEQLHSVTAQCMLVKDYELTLEFNCYHDHKMKEYVQNKL